MAEPTVQVPVSLIERIDSAYNASSDTLAALIEQLWMLSQPTPTAEPILVRYNHGGSATWTAVETTPGMWRINEWGPTMMQDTPAEQFWSEFTRIDPSTIHDVTPPPVTP